MHSTCVIYNPAAGRGRAERILTHLPPALAWGVELRRTTHRGHATEIAREASIAGFSKVVAAGGDGTVHEVANGVLQSDRRDIIFSVWPLGSANDFAYSLGMDIWWQRHAEPPPTTILNIDVGRAATPRRIIHFVCNLGVGFNGMINEEARKTRWLKGLPLYALAFIKSMVKHFDRPTMTVTFDERVVKTPTLALSVLNGQREGNFPLRPMASLTDGLLDYMHATRLTRWHLLRFLPAMVRGKLPTHHKLVGLGRASRIHLSSEAPLCVHADGEFLSVPEEQNFELSIEVIPSRLQVEVYHPALYGRRE
jgi:YegS/Rv2252/BmrU family lipid kinase